MERHLKQRLLAAIVLLALIVIFVPMLFRKHKQETDIVTINSIPQAPAQADVQQMTSPVSSNELITSSSSADGSSEYVSTEPAIASQPGSADIYAGGQRQMQEPSPVVETLPQVPSEPSELYDALPVGKSDKSSKSNKTASNSSQSIMALSQSVLSPHSVKQFHLRGTNVSSSNVDHDRMEMSASQKKQMATAKSLAEGWVVQLGYFASHANAKKLQNDLRSKGFKAFTYNDREGDKSRYRVYVGPMLNKTLAEQERQKLAKQHISSIVVKYDAARSH